MIPGTVTRLTETTVASADVISVKSDVVIVTGATAINTIIPAFGNVDQFLVLIPTTGVTLGTTGNILVGIAAAVNRAVFLVYSRSLAKWVINSGV